MDDIKENVDRIVFVPLELRDYEMCYFVVSKKGILLHHVPVHLRDEKMCSKAVEMDARALAYVKNKNYYLCLRAVQQNGLAISLVPPEFRNMNLILTAVRQNGCALGYLNKSEITEEVRREALNQT